MIKGTFGSKEATTTWKDVWKYAMITFGEPFVEMDGALQMFRLLAGSWDFYQNVSCLSPWDSLHGHCSFLKTGVQLVFPRKFEPGFGPIWLSNVQCDRTESRVTDCPASVLGDTLSCDHSQDAEVICCMLT